MDYRNIVNEDSNFESREITYNEIPTGIVITFPIETPESTWENAMVGYIFVELPEDES